MKAVKQRPAQAVTLLSPSLFGKHPSGAHEKDGALVTATGQNLMSLDTPRRTGRRISLEHALWQGYMTKLSVDIRLHTGAALNRHADALWAASPGVSHEGAAENLCISSVHKAGGVGRRDIRS
jgi:hypothetical protein